MGRDGKPSLAVVIPSKSATQRADKSMKEYEVNQKTCHRDFLFSDVDNYSHEDCGRSVYVVMYVLSLVIVVYVLTSTVLLSFYNNNIKYEGMK